MTDEIYFDGERFISAHDAAHAAGLTRDYVAKLCRDGKVIGKRIGKNWYLNERSFNDFLLTQERSRDERRAQLAKQRQLEYASSISKHVAVGEAPKISAPAVPKPIVESDEAPSHVTHTPSHPVLSRVVRESNLSEHLAVQTFARHAAGVQARMAAAVAAQGGNVLKHASDIASSPLGVSDAAIRALHVPVYTVTPFVEFVHRLTALVIAFTLTFGTYSLVDPDGARFALDSARGSVRSIGDTYQSITGGGAGTLAARTQSQLAAVAENPGAVASSVSQSIQTGVPSLAQRIARAINSSVDQLVYAVAFPIDTVRSVGATPLDATGSVQISIAPYARARASDAAVQVAAATTSRGGANTASANVRVIERTIETQRILAAGGITESELDQRLADLESRLSARISHSYSVASPVSFSTTPVAAPNYTPIGIATKIDHLSGVAISGGTISGAQISDTSISATSLGVSGTSTLATTTVNGTLTVNSGGSNPFTINDAAGALLFRVNEDGTLTANVASTTSSYSSLLVTGNATATNLVVVDTASSTKILSTNATSTNLFATYAHFATGLFDSFTTTLADITGLTATNATTTNATTTNLYASGRTTLATTTISGDLTLGGSLNFTNSSSVITANGGNFNFASTSRLSVFSDAYFGGTATSTFDSAGNLSVAGNATTSGYAFVSGSGIFGAGNSATGTRAFSQGATNAAGGNYSAVIAASNAFSYGALSAIISGANNVITGQYSTAIGGYNNNISGNYSTVLNGAGSSVSGTGSIAVGKGLTVTGDNSFAIGLGSGGTVSASNVAAILGGNVGIGTVQPQSALDVVGNTYVRNTAGAVGSNDGVEIATDSSAPRVSLVQGGRYVGLFSGDAPGNTYLKNVAGGALLFYGGSGGNSENARLTNNGYLGIGTTSPWKMLSVAGDIIGTNITATGTLSVAGASAFTGLGSFVSASSSVLSVFNKAYFGGTATSTIDSAGNAYFVGTVGVGTTSPSTDFAVAGNTYTTGGLGVGVRNTTAGTLQTSGNANIGGSLTLGTALTNANGGTGFASYAAGDILYADNVGTLAKLPIGSTGQVLKVQAGLPAWGLDATGGGASSAGNFWATTTLNLIYPVDTSYPVAIGSNATSTLNSIFEVAGQQYISSKLGIATTSPTTALSVGGNAYLTGGLGVGIYNTAAGTLLTSGAATIGGNLAVTGTSGFTGLGTFTSGFVSQASSTVVGTLQAVSSGSNATINNPTDGVGIILRGAGNSTTGQLRIVANGGAWTDSTSTTYFQIVGGNNRNAVFQGGTYGDDTALNRLGFNASSTQFSDTTYGSTPVPNSLFGISNTTAGKSVLALKGAASQSGDYVQISSNGGTGDILKIASTGYFGIGTTTPWKMLSVAGDIIGTNITATGTLAISGLSTLTSGFVSQASSTVVGTLTATATTTASGGITGPNNFTVQQNTGRVGIGTASPSGLLHILYSFAGSNPFVVNDGTRNVMQLSSGGAFSFGTAYGYGAGAAFNIGSGLDGISSGASELVVNPASVDSSSYVARFQEGGADRFVINGDGYVGIGTTSPWKMLSVAGDIIGTNITATGTLSVAGASAFTGLLSSQNASTTLFSAYGPAYFGGTATSSFASNGALSLVSNGLTVGTNQLVVSGGNVGIGTASPSTTLQVIGTTTAQSFQVYANSAPQGNGIFQLSGANSSGVEGRNLAFSSGGQVIGFAYKNSGGDGVWDFGSDNGSNSKPAIYLSRPGATDMATWRAESGIVVFGGLLANQKLQFSVGNNSALQVDTDYALTGGYDGTGGQALVLRGGAAASSNNGGDVRLQGSAAAGTNKDGGNIIMQPSAGTGTGWPGRVGIGTTTPFGLFSISANNGTAYPNNLLFHIASSTASATTTLFSISNTGAVVMNGTLSVSNLATLSSGFVSQASSTVVGQFNSTYSSSTAYTASGTIYANAASTTNLTISSVPSALVLTSSTGAAGAYAGSACTNQFVRSLNGAGVATCATVTNTDLQNSSLTVTAGTGLSGGGAVSLGGSTSLSLNTGNANTWTALQQFASGASTTLFSAYGPAYFGGTATSSFATNGALTLATALTVANGGTGATSITGLVKGNGTSAFTAAVAGTDYENPLTFSTGLTRSTNTITLNTGNANTWTALQQFASGASTTLFSAYGPVYFGGTATSTFDSAGNLDISQYASIKQNGSSILYASSTNNSIAVGPGAGYKLYSNASATYNTAVGSSALTNGSLSGTRNNAFGAQSLYSLTSGGNNNAFGVGALYSLQGASDNVGIGDSAGYNNQGGAANVYIGKDSGLGSAGQGQNYNVGVGYRSLYSVLGTSGNSNTAIGYQAGYTITSGSNNVILGSNSTNNVITSGSNNVVIGTDPRAGLTATASNQLNIGNFIFGTGLGSGTTLGTGNLGIGTTTPYSRLSVWGGSSGNIFESVTSASSTAFLINSSGNVGIGTTSPGSIFAVNGVANLFASATSTFYYGLNTPYLNVTGTAASSTFANGINLSSGCFSINGTCLSAGGGGGSLTGSTGQIAYFSGTNSAVGTSTIFISTAGHIGLGTTTPTTIYGATSLSRVFTIQSSGSGTAGFRLYTPSNNGGTGLGADWEILAGSGGGLNFANSGTFRMLIDSSGNVGIGTTTPFRNLSVAAATNGAQVAVSYDTTRNTDLLTDSAGDLNISPSGGDIRENDGNLWVCSGGSCPSGAPSGTGNLVVENAIGIGTSSPQGSFAVVSTGGSDAASPKFFTTDTNYAQIMLGSAMAGYKAAMIRYINGNGTAASARLSLMNYGDGEAISIVGGGKVGVGTTTPTDALSVQGLLRVGANSNAPVTLGTATSTFNGDIKILGKLDVGTIDPVYTIGGEKWATYGHSTVGIHEETLQTIELAQQADGTYAYIIDFDSLEKGSDLWLFYQITNFGDRWQNLIVSLTPSFDGKVFYKKLPGEHKLAIYGDAAGEVSMRLAGDRYDFSKWPNLRPDQDGKTEGTHVISEKPARAPAGLESAARIQN